MFPTAAMSLTKNKWEHTQPDLGSTLPQTYDVSDNLFLKIKSEFSYNLYTNSATQDILEKIKTYNISKSNVTLVKPIIPDEEIISLFGAIHNILVHYDGMETFEDLLWFVDKIKQSISEESFESISLLAEAYLYTELKGKNGYKFSLYDHKTILSKVIFNEAGSSNLTNKIVAFWKTFAYIQNILHTALPSVYTNELNDGALVLATLTTPLKVDSYELIDVLSALDIIYKNNELNLSSFGISEARIRTIKPIHHILAPTGTYKAHEVLQAIIANQNYLRKIVEFRNTVNTAVDISNVKPAFITDIVDITGNSCLINIATMNSKYRSNSTKHISRALFITINDQVSGEWHIPFYLVNDENCIVKLITPFNKNVFDLMYQLYNLKKRGPLYSEYKDSYTLTNPQSKGFPDAVVDYISKNNTYTNEYLRFYRNLTTLPPIDRILKGNIKVIYSGLEDIHKYFQEGQCSAGKEQNIFHAFIIENINKTFLNSIITNDINKQKEV